MRKAICTAMVVCAAAAGWAAPAENTDALRLRSMIPSDPVFCIAVSDVSDLQETLLETPVGRFLQDPEVKRFLAPTREQLDLIRETLSEEEAVVPEDWAKYFPGEIVLYGGELLMRETQVGMPVGFAAEIGLPRERYQVVIDQFVESLPNRSESETFVVDDVTVTVVNYRLIVRNPGAPPAQPGVAAPQEISLPASFQYAFVGDILLINSGAREDMIRMIERLRAPAAPASIMARPAIGRAVRYLSGSPQILLYLSPAKIAIPLIERFQPMLNAAAQPAPQAVNLTALGVQEIDGMTLAFHFRKDRIAAAFVMTMPEDGAGVVSILRYQMPSSFATAGLVPGEALSYSSIAGDWDGMYLAIRAMMQRVSPAAHLLFSMALGQLETLAQVRVGDLLATLGGEIATYEMLTDDPGQPLARTVVLAVRDAQRLSELIDTLILSMKGTTAYLSGQYKGYTIRTLEPVTSPTMTATQEMMAQQLQRSWVLTEKYAAVSNTSASVRTFIDFLTGERDDSLNETATYKAARGLLPEGIDSFKMTRTGELGTHILQRFLASAEQPYIGDQIGEYVDVTAPPAAATLARYFGLTVWGTELEPGSRSTVMVFAAPSATAGSPAAESPVDASQEAAAENPETAIEE